MIIVITVFTYSKLTVILVTDSMFSAVSVSEQAQRCSRFVN